MSSKREIDKIYTNYKGGGNDNYLDLLGKLKDSTKNIAKKEFDKCLGTKWINSN